jgi:hypothetical protein
MPVSFKPILVINIKNGVGSGPSVEISRSKVLNMKNSSYPRGRCQKIVAACIRADRSLNTQIEKLFFIQEVTDDFG